MIELTEPEYATLLALAEAAARYVEQRDDADAAAYDALKAAALAYRAAFPQMREPKETKKAR